MDHYLDDPVIRRYKVTVEANMRRLWTSSYAENPTPSLPLRR